MLAEKIFNFSDSSEARHLIGMHDELLQTMRQEFPSLALSSRGQDLFIKGPEEEANILESMLLHLRALDRDKVYATTQQVRYITKLVRDGKSDLVEMMHEDTIALSDKGRPVKPKTLGQKAYVDMIRRQAVTFGIGPAGTGKTYLAVALASYYLKNREVERIILTRPAVEAGEKLGFLPGDLQEKVDPYLRPLYDALSDMFGLDTVQKMLARNIIEVAPLAYMRGRTLEESFVILDEAQNTTREQMKMFLTRMGMNTKMIVTGDITQIDLPRMQQSGLIEAIRILRHIQGISFVEMDKSDIVRHKLVARIVKAYEQTTHKKDDASTTEEQQQISEECYSNN